MPRKWWKSCSSALRTDHGFPQQPVCRQRRRVFLCLPIKIACYYIVRYVICANELNRTCQPASTSASLRLDDQLCFALYSASLAMNKAYREAPSTGHHIPAISGAVGVVGERPAVGIGDWRTAVSRFSDTDAFAETDGAGGVGERDRSPSDERVVIVSLTRRAVPCTRTASGFPPGCCVRTRLSVDNLVGLRSELNRCVIN